LPSTCNLSSTNPLPNPTRNQKINQTHLSLC
jgi:hypothetical protein